MANTNAPFGFRHIGPMQGGGVSNYGLGEYKIVYNYGTAMFKGDVLVQVSSGYCERYQAGYSGSNVVGIVEGFAYYSASQGRKVLSTYLPVGDTPYDIEVQVVPIAGVPPQLFLVQAAGTQFTKADFGATLEPTVSGTGTAVGGLGKSAMTITQDSGNIGVTNTYPFRVINLYSSIAPIGTPGTEAASYNIVIVASNPFEAAGI